MLSVRLDEDLERRLNAVCFSWKTPFSLLGFVPHPNLPSCHFRKAAAVSASSRSRRW